ncbi:MAG: hypothetical protein ACRDPC_06035 [Solirubrobacteraceae bacterium]
MTDLAVIYDGLARRRTRSELADAYRTAYLRGAPDLPPTASTARPLGLLTTAVPRLISLAVATYAVHILPSVDAPERVTLAGDLLATIDATAAGSLRRCDLALAADGRRRGYSAEEWLPIVYDVADDSLRHASPMDEPPPAVHLSQDAGRWVAMAIDALDRDAPSVTECLADALGRLLVVCMFADVAYGRSPTLGG